MSVHAGVALVGKNSQKCRRHCQILPPPNLKTNKNTGQNRLIYTFTITYKYTDHLLMDFSISSSPVLLRPLEPEDLELLYTIENDATLWDVCDDTTPYSRYALRQYIANQPQDLHQCRELRLIIVERQTSAPIGIVDLVNYSPKNQRAEISIALLRHKRGKGYGEKAIFLLEEYVQRFYGIRMLYALVSSRNNALANSMFKSLGYECIACLPQWHKRGDDFEDIDVFQKILEKRR